MDEGKLYINNVWRDGEGSIFVSHNPASYQSIWRGACATKDDVDQAVAAARESAEMWGNTSLEERIKIIEKFQEELRAATNTLVVAISEEVGKPLWESRSEVGAMISKIPISIEAHKERCIDRSKPLGDNTSMVRHRPHGVVAVLGPFNFPGHLPNGHIIPALLAGNCVVFKPSELTPKVGELYVKLWHKVGLPRGVLNLVQGGGETGQNLAFHEGINALFFTGSTKTGHILSTHFGKTPRKLLALEMGGNNPLVISKVSDVTAAAYNTVQSAFLTSGQRCTCARRAILIDGACDKNFLPTLIEITQNLKIAPYSSKVEPFMGPLITKEAADRVREKQKELKMSGGKILLEARRVGYALLSPSIIDVTNCQERDDVETFGPLLQVIHVPDLEAAIKEANNTKYGLAAGIFTNSSDEYDTFRQHVRAGVINWNTQLTGASSSAPFGGVDNSGNYRPSAYYAADYCSYPVASIESDKISIPEKLVPGVTLPSKGVK